MNYNTSDTSEMNNIDFVENDTENGVSITSSFALNTNKMINSNNYSATSPFSNTTAMMGGNNYSATSPFSNTNTMMGGNNYSATSPFAYSSDNGNAMMGGNNYSATSPFAYSSDNMTGGSRCSIATQNGGMWPFSSSTDKLLYAALSEQNLEALIFLTKHLDDISQKKHGKTILHHVAYQYNSIPNVHKLVSAILSRRDVKKFINIKEDHTGNTALHIAAKNGNYDLCGMLINAGLDPKIKNKEGLYVESESEPEIMTTSYGKVIDNSNSKVFPNSNMNNSNNKSTESYVRNLLNVFLQLDKNTVKLQCTETDNSMPSHLSMTANTHEYLEGGSDSNSNLFNTEQFVDQLLQKYNNLNDSESTIMNEPMQQGGNRKTLIGTRRMTTLSDVLLSGGNSSTESERPNRRSRHETETDSDSSETELSRLIKRQSDEIHDRTVKKIMELMNVDEKTARNYKAAIYRKVKEAHPELNNLDRAVEMEKLAIKTELKKIDIKKVTKEIEDHISKKQSESESSETPKNSKDKKNMSKSKPKNKKALSVTSPASVPSESGFSFTSEY